VSGWSSAAGVGDARRSVLRVLRPAVLGLVTALAFSASDTITVWWWLPALVAVGGVAFLLDRMSTPPPGRGAVEMAAAALIIGFSWDDSLVALPYLLIPGFAVSLSRGLKGALGATAIAAATLGLTVALSVPSPSEFSAAAAGFVPWLVLVLAIGLIGTWFRRQASDDQVDMERYASAFRLLSQLRVISRRLSAGLDPLALAAGLLEESQHLAPGGRAAVLVRSDGGVLIPLARSGAKDDSWLAVVERDAVVLDAWTTEHPRAVEVAEGSRTVVPLRIGTRTMGVLVLDSPTKPTDSAIGDLSRVADAGALRLETALLFDEIRETATREERQRVAREIHDGIAQELASLGYLVDEIEASSTWPEARARSAGLRDEFTRIISELRLSIFDLRSDVNPDAGLGAAVAEHARRVGATSGLTVHLVLEESARRLPREPEAELLRIVQEAVTNARKHSGAENLWVRVSVDPPRAVVSIEDDGRGLGQARDDSFGLRIMSERARHIGANFSIGPRPEGGTVVRVVLGTETEGADGDKGVARRRS
jgi:signal transduction histidine kinase